MGRYNWKIENMLYEEDVRKLFDAANNRAKALISVLWLTGARPGEIVKMKVCDVQATDNRLFLTLLTLKLKKGDDGSFIPNKRILEFERVKDANVYIEAIISYAGGFDQGEGALFQYSTRWVEKTISELSLTVLNHPVSPYHFRHSVMMWGARAGWTLDKLMYFKGSMNAKSVEKYIHGAPQLISADAISNRRRIAEAKPAEPSPPSGTG